MNSITQDATKISVAELAVEDFPSLGRIIRSFGRESKLVEQFSLPVDYAHFANEVEAMVNVGAAEGFVAREEDTPIGVIIYLIHKHLFTAAWTFTELVWYVMPEHRNTTVGLRLYQAMRRRAKKVDMQLITMIYLKNSMPERMKDFYESQGYLEVETSYVLRL